MKWLNESEIVIDNRVYHITNPSWIKNVIEAYRNDNDTPKDQEATKSP